MRVAVLTSSRADYGIYLPLLKKLNRSQDFQLHVFAFGTHLSALHGRTIAQIEDDGFEIAEAIESLIVGDSPSAIANSIGNTISRFADVWQRWAAELDIVFALGDRFEMFAAVAAATPFNIKVAHLHGGETTLGAIDDMYRHSISHMAMLHFTATQVYADKVAHMVGSRDYVHHVGALSLDNLNELNLYSCTAFNDRYGIDLSRPTILCTLHPETVDYQNNQANAITLAEVFRSVEHRYQVVITMPNADTSGGAIRAVFDRLQRECEHVYTVESLGSRGYFSCMSLASFLLGNTSSGLIEAPGVHKYAINIGSRQAGRVRGANVIDVGFSCEEILMAIDSVAALGNYLGENPYQASSNQVADAIVKVLKKL